MALLTMLKLQSLGPRQEKMPFTQAGGRPWSCLPQSYSYPARCQPRERQRVPARRAGPHASPVMGVSMGRERAKPLQPHRTEDRGLTNLTSSQVLSLSSTEVFECES